MTATADTGVEGQDQGLDTQPGQPDPTTTPTSGTNGTGVHPHDNGGPQAHTKGVRPNTDNGGPQAHDEEQPVD